MKRSAIHPAVPLAIPLAIPLGRRDGQAVFLVVLSMSLLLIGVLGFVIDGGQMYLQQQMAQAAADVALVPSRILMMPACAVSGKPDYVHISLRTRSSTRASETATLRLG